MLIWDNSPQTLLSILLSSTTSKFSVSELSASSGLSRMTVYNVMLRLTRNGIVIREVERVRLESGCTPHVYYTLNPDAFHHIELGAAWGPTA